MNVRLVVSVALLFSSYAHGQQMSHGGNETEQPAYVTANAGSEFKQQLMRRIAVEEAAARQGESAHAANVVLSRAYVQLGLLYQDVAWWERSEAALERAVSLLRHPSESSADLAAAISQLGELHILMGKLRDGEKEELEALKLRQDLGDRLQIARSWDDLAVVYLKEQKFVKARALAQQAATEFVTNGAADALDRIFARLALSQALCSLKDYPSAIPLLKAALDEAKTTLLPNDFPLGLSDFLLGYAYWKSGNTSEADEYLKQGTTLMSTQLGWGHPAYLAALKHYVQFLRENRRTEAANVVESRIRQAEAVVDVHSIQARQGMFGFDGLP
jgi:tetratricopeptide (TPR) repeat protein